MSALSTRDLANQLGDYFGKAPIARIAPVDVQPVGLNPRAWPRCKHCGGNVNCADYDPDTQGPLWGETE
jgi:hypothetical protein